VRPVVRDLPISAALKLMLMLMPPWGVALWGSYYGMLYPARKPEDFKAHRAALTKSLRRPV